jgi:hypothetical protein
MPATNYDVATAPAAVLVGTEKLYITGKQHTTPNALKAFFGSVTPAQLATEVARIAALETSQGTQDTAIGLLLLPKADVLDTYAGGATKAASAERAKDLDARITTEVTARTALAVRVAILETHNLAVGNTVRSGNFNGVLGSVEPFRIDVASAVCTPPATGTLTEGVEFGVVLYGTPGGSFNCLVDFQTAGQSLHGRTGSNANVIITTEVTPFKVRWNAALTSWFIVS